MLIYAALLAFALAHIKILNAMAGDAYVALLQSVVVDNNNKYNKITKDL